MTRTNLTARHSTGGRPPFLHVPSLGCGQVRPCFRHGKWFHICAKKINERSRRAVLGDDADDGVKILLEPNVNNLTDGIPDFEDDQAEDTHDLEDQEIGQQPTEAARAGACNLLALPDELLLRVTQYLVPSNGIVHVTKRWNLTVINVIMPSDERTDLEHRRDAHWLPVRDELTAVARTCHHLNEMYNSLLYGDNQWVFELSSRDPASGGVIMNRGCGQLSSWCSLYDAELAGAWPLTERTVPHVKRLSILSTIGPPEQRTEPPLMGTVYLRSNVASLIEAFMGNHNLRRLTVDTRMAGESCREGRKWHVCEIDSGGSPFLRSWKQGYCEHTPDGIAWLWDLMQQLRGVSEISLGGLISQQDATAVADRMCCNYEDPVQSTYGYRFT